ncbi:MAG: delta(1)-pyrroline-2-carboxylate reductase family protein [Hydrogenophaga sp.]|uniref:delta(1)-pyrroline-2-carboxylate reductase family protein n=1 Tax=Hydrogenophaga sp. TaxID=1904254 RepID=UPI001D809A2C|nr:delta(1)-pyrroline-2-carboxylate reductase family protein [Hydrogenophaga sp.]MBX3609379.1 delta(1)-pyrroline-2-carboxylate reductase family protein [Hydrogenophaga sp.]
MTDTLLMSPAATAAALPYPALADAIAAVLRDPDVRVPARIVMPLPAGGSLFVMPATDKVVAITKLISFVADNGARQLPTIQGDIVIFDARDGHRLAMIDGPTVTARRTAAVSLLAARVLAPRTDGPLLIVGAGVQGRAHLEAFASGLGVREVRIASRSAHSAHALAEHARALGVSASVVPDADAALADCPLVVSCTPAQGVVLRGTPRDDAFVAAVGAFTPAMVEWAPEVCRDLLARGLVVVDTRDADHEAGDLLQAGIDVPALPTLAQRLDAPRPARGPVFFKSCGWAGWDLAAARLVSARMGSTGARA